MCWQTRKKENTKPRVAKRNIKVFKVVHHYKYPSDYAIPLYYAKGINYYVGNTYTLKEPIIVVANIINPGYHSYSPREVRVEYGSNDTSMRVANTKWCGTLDCRHLHYDSHYAIMHCVIPKGTTYFKNEYGEYVSESLKVIRFEDFKRPDRPY